MLAARWTVGAEPLGEQVNDGFPGTRREPVPLLRAGAVYVPQPRTAAAMAGRGVHISDADRGHERVGGGRPDEAKTLPLQGLRERD